jgi:hypothetical protein
MQGREQQPRPSGWVLPENRNPIVRANGRAFEFDPNTEFLKAVNEVAKEVGFNATFYVHYSSTPDGGLKVIADPSAAPATLAAGNIVELRPHSEAA